MTLFNIFRRLTAFCSQLMYGQQPSNHFGAQSAKHFRPFNLNSLRIYLKNWVIAFRFMWEFLVSSSTGALSASTNHSILYSLFLRLFAVFGHFRLFLIFYIFFLLRLLAARNGYWWPNGFACYPSIAPWLYRCLIWLPIGVLLFFEIYCDLIIAKFICNFGCKFLLPIEVVSASKFNENTDLLTTTLRWNVKLFAWCVGWSAWRNLLLLILIFSRYVWII